MVLKQDTYKSETSSTENSVTGCSLRKGKLKKWIYGNGFNMWSFSKRLKLTAEQFNKMLTNQELFNENQMKRLIETMGAEEAFKVIYFPSLKEKKRVYYEVFKKYEEKEDYD